MINHDIFPLFCLSAERNMGSGRLMGFIDNVCPSANEMPPQKTKKEINLPAMPMALPVFLFIKQLANHMLVNYLFLKCIQEL